MCQAILCDCLVCGKQFTGSKHKSNKFCSTSCYRTPQGKALTKNGKEKSKKGDCTHCGKDVFGNHSGRESVFCNRICYDAHRVNIWKSRAVECARCGNPVIGAGVSAGTQIRKYCSHECRTADKKPEPKVCISCGVLFSAIKFRKHKDSYTYARVSDQKTCTRACLAEFFRMDPDRKVKISKAFTGEKHPAWVGGSHNGSYRGAGWREIAESAREKAGRCCEHCGKTEHENGRKLDVNHIVPFHQHKNKSDANKPSNLEALCRSCHTKTDYLWKKNNSVQFVLDIFGR